MVMNPNLDEDLQSKSRSKSKIYCRQKLVSKGWLVGCFLSCFYLLMLRGVDFIDITSLVGWGSFDIFHIFTFSTCTNPIIHLFYPQKNLHRHCVRLLLGHVPVPGEIANNEYPKFWGVNQSINQSINNLYLYTISI